MEKVCKKLYFKKESYADDESYWYYDAQVLEMPEFPSIYLELHTSYDENSGITRKGYTLIKAGKIPEPFHEKRPDDTEIELKHESGEEIIDDEKLGDFCRESWVGGFVILGINNYLSLYSHPEWMENKQGQHNR